MAAINVTPNEMRQILKSGNKQQNYDKQKNNGENSKMQNKLSDLNNHLFEQLERLNDEDLTDEQLDKEIKRAKSVASIAGNIINNGNLMLNTMKFMDEAGYTMETELRPDKLLGMTKDERI